MAETSGDLLVSYLKNCCAELGVGGRLPTELELCRRFDVSRSTVVRAMRRLDRAGYCERLQGKGVFVKGAGRRKIFFLTPSLDHYRLSGSGQFQAIRLLNGIIEAVAEYAAALEYTVIDLDHLDITQLAGLPPYSDVIFFGHGFLPVVPELNRRHCRIVAIRREAEEEQWFDYAANGCMSVVIPRYAATVATLRKLFERGKRRIVLLYDHTMGHPDNPVRRGYRDGLIECGLPYDPLLEIPVDPRIVSALIATMLKAKNRYPFDTIICSHYQNAIMAASALMQHGIKLQSEIALWALSAGRPEELALCTLPSLSCEYTKAGQTAVRLLLDEHDSREVTLSFSFNHLEAEGGKK